MKTLSEKNMAIETQSKISNGSETDTGSAQPLVVKSKVRDYIHQKECNASGEVLDNGALDKVIKEVLDKAVERAKANGRKTVMEKDL